MANKIEKSELEVFTSARNKYLECKSAISDLAILKKNAERNLERALEDEPVLLNEYQEIKNALVSKYGEVDINLETGEYVDKKG